ncbi:MAG TPA: DUF5993 family protein [Hyphomicrobium sp.]|jgi:hypothetical protein
MDFFVIFLVLAASLWAAWRGPARASVLLFAGALLLTVATYLHHATDRLPLSF